MSIEIIGREAHSFLTFQEQQPEYHTDEMIKGHVLVMLLGGTETVATAMEWALANLLNHPQVLKKAKTELDTQVGDHLIEESDFEKLQYLRCIISETLRLYPAVPLLVPRLASADCTIGGYDVPAGTTLTLGSLTQCFEWERVGEDKIEMTEKTGITMSKVEPLELMCKARPILNMHLS